jgi:hypothetical protein
MKKGEDKIEDMVRIMKLCRSLKTKIVEMGLKGKHFKKFQCRHICLFCKYRKICKEDL